MAVILTPGATSSVNTSGVSKTPTNSPLLRGMHCQHSATDRASHVRRQRACNSLPPARKYRSDMTVQTILQNFAGKGCRNRLCVDFSVVAAETMRKRHVARGLSDKIRWETLDVRYMEDKIPNASVDVAFDKGTLDAMIHGSPWSPPENTIANTGRVT